MGGRMLAWLLATALGADEGPRLDPSPPPPLPPETWDAVRRAAVDHLEARRKVRIAGMSTLVAWSAANLGAGAVGWATADDPDWIHFHQMNLAWGGINLAIAVPGLVGALKDDPSTYDLGKVLRADTGDRVVFGLNAGLDVGYVAAGAWLWERGERLDDPLLRGFGRSVVLQGGFLLLFDAVMLGLHTRDARRFLLVPEVGEVLGVRLVIREGP